MSLVRGARVSIDLETEQEWMTIGGVRSRRFEIRSETADATDALSEGWRRLLPCGGLRSAELTVNGVFSSSEAASRMRALALDGGIATWRLNLPGTGAMRGPFQVSALHYDADESGEMMFRARLSSAGPLNFDQESPS